jgi:hypothetical protein
MNKLSRRILAAITLALFPGAVSSQSDLFTDVKGGTINVNGGTIDAPTNTVNVLVVHPSTSVTATASNRIGGAQVRVLQGERSCFREPITAEFVNGAIEQQIEALKLRVSALSTPLEKIEALESINRVELEIFRFITSQIEAKAARIGDLTRNWPAEQNFSATIPNCYHRDTLADFTENGIKPVVRAAVNATLEPLRQEVTEDPDELGDKELIQ